MTRAPADACDDASATPVGLVIGVGSQAERVIRALQPQIIARYGCCAAVIWPTADRAPQVRLDEARSARFLIVLTGEEDPGTAVGLLRTLGRGVAPSVPVVVIDALASAAEADRPDVHALSGARVALADEGSGDMAGAALACLALLCPQGLDRDFDGSTTDRSLWSRGVLRCQQVRGDREHVVRTATACLVDGRPPGAQGRACFVLRAPDDAIAGVDDGLDLMLDVATGAGLGDEHIAKWCLEREPRADYELTILRT